MEKLKIIRCLIFCFMFLLSCNRKIRVAQIEFVGEILYQEEIKEYPVKIINDKKSFEKIIGNKNKTIFKLYAKINPPSIWH